MGSLRCAFVSALLLLAYAACFAESMQLPDDVHLPTITQYQLLSMHSGRFVGATGDNCIHAMGDIRDPRTKFIPRFTLDGKIAFESYCTPGHYLVFDQVAFNNNTTTHHIRLGVPANGSELFEQNTPFPGAFAYKSVTMDERECYVAFDAFGNAHVELLCVLNTSHMATLIRYIESVDETECDHVHLKTTRVEL